MRRPPKEPNDYWIDQDNIIHIMLRNIHGDIVAETLIDIIDFKIVSQYRWHCIVKSNTSYARTHIYNPPNVIHHSILMHRLLIEIPTNSKLMIDHINGNGLDNRRKNIRLATNIENGRNSKRPRNNASGFKGVSWVNRDNKWLARIMITGKRLFLGYFDNPEDAAKAYDKAALKYHKNFAQLNFPCIYTDLPMSNG